MKPFFALCSILVFAGNCMVGQSNLGKETDRSLSLALDTAVDFNFGRLPQSHGLNFAPAVSYGSGGVKATSIAVGDVNGDGKPDLVVANDRARGYCADDNCRNGSVSILLGNGDGTFQAAVSYGTGGESAASVAVGDVNGDGKLDLLVANYVSSNVGVLLGNGNGTFQAAVAFRADAVAVAVADVNGDGKLDLLLADQNFAVEVFLGNGDGTFRFEGRYPSGSEFPVYVAVADVNGDSKPDLLVANLCASEEQCEGGSVSVLLGNGDGTFQGAVVYSSLGSDTNSVAVQDVNGDGKPDLLVVSPCSGAECPSGVVAVLLGNGDGTFDYWALYGSGGMGADSIEVADVNGDGKPDLLVANQSECADSECHNGSVGVLLGNGDGTFQVAASYSSGAAWASSVAVADVNGDGKPDLLVANNCPGPNICNDGSGTVGVLINIGTP